VQDKAALLAGMEPDAVARLLGCMDPNEAVLLLSALGDGSSKLVAGYLSGEERDKMIEVGWPPSQTQLDAVAKGTAEPRFIGNVTVPTTAGSRADGCKIEACD
jgi:hypothetical protein